MANPSEKIAFVTGASSGVGKVVAKHLASLGYCVAVGYTHNEHNAQAVVREINTKANNAGFAIHIDYSDLSSVKQAVSSVEQHFNGSISLLVNNGAIAQEKDYLTITEDDFNRMINTNLAGPFFACQQVIPAMLENKYGKIINISSIGGQWGGVNQLHYAAAKAGLINLTKSLAKLYSAKGISSHCIAIGLVETEMSKRELATEAGKQKVANIPSGRLATKEEIAETISFLVSDNADYLSGQTLNMNGGMLFN